MEDLPLFLEWYLYGIGLSPLDNNNSKFQKARMPPLLKQLKVPTFNINVYEEMTGEIPTSNKDSSAATYFEEQ